MKTEKDEEEEKNFTRMTNKIKKTFSKNQCLHFPRKNYEARDVNNFFPFLAIDCSTGTFETPLVKNLCCPNSKLNWHLFLLQLHYIIW
jgi:hypothetical protein